MEKILPKLKTKKWFYNRINKTVYRDNHKCCPQCDDIFENGLIIHDKNHADYLYNIQCEFAFEKVYLNYRDKK